MVKVVPVAALVVSPAGNPEVITVQLYGATPFEAVQVVE